MKEVINTHIFIYIYISLIRIVSHMYKYSCIYLSNFLWSCFYLRSCNDIYELYGCIMFDLCLYGSFYLTFCVYLYLVRLRLLFYKCCIHIYLCPYIYIYMFAFLSLFDSVTFIMFDLLKYEVVKRIITFLH